MANPVQAMLTIPNCCPILCQNNISFRFCACLNLYGKGYHFFKKSIGALSSVNVGLGFSPICKISRNLTQFQRKEKKTFLRTLIESVKMKVGYIKSI